MSSHFIFAAFPIWGHTRPQLALALNLLASNPSLHITFLTSSGFRSVVDSEILRFYGTSSSSPSSATRLRVAPVGNATTKIDISNIGEQLGAFFEALPGALGPIIAGGKGGEGFESRPTLAVADGFLVAFIDILQGVAASLEVDPMTIPTYVFCPTTAASYIEHYGSAEDNGHFSQLEAKAKTLIEKGLLDPTGKDPLEVLLVAQGIDEGKLVSYPGTVPMYDYELSPQLDCASLSPPVIGMLVASAAQIKKSAGIVLPAAAELEVGAREALEKTYGIPVLEVGPQFPERWWKNPLQNDGEPLNTQDQEVITFLDSCQDRFGPKSMLYISFGSVFFPAGRPDMVRALINSLLTASPPVPFLFALAGCPADLAAELSASLKGNDLALVSPFVPQMNVLRHPATGWFLTHCGSNSMSESMLTGTPLVAWPISADQPLLSSFLSQKLQVAIELIQVRNGTSVGRPTARGTIPTGKPEDLDAEFVETWKKIHGEEGKALRVRMGQVSEQIKSSWESGESRKAMEAFTKYLSPPPVARKGMLPGFVLVTAFVLLSVCFSYIM